METSKACAMVDKVLKKLMVKLEQFRIDQEGEEHEEEHISDVEECILHSKGIKRNEGHCKRQKKMQSVI